MPIKISPAELRRLDWKTDEVALIDVREEGVFARGHLFRAVPLALSQLELHIRRLVPRFQTRLILMDDGAGLAAEAAKILERHSYTQVALLDGNLKDCAADGFQIFEGVNVPSKAFGEFVELACDTPHIKARELKAALERGDDLVVLDARPLDEYTAMHIPGALSCPSQELFYRFDQLVTRPSTTVVVNCAGRTRSIIGAQSLINAQVPNRVMALENGAMGWHLAGFTLERQNAGQSAAARRPNPGATLAMAAKIAARSGVHVIDRETLQRLRAQQDSQTLYVFDVRPLSEYLAGHLPEAVPVEGVQLVQKTDAYIAVPSARIVIADDDGVRARMTAAWLAQMGFPFVAVLADSAGEALASGPYRPQLLYEPAWDLMIEPAELERRLRQAAVTVIDFSRSLSFKARHIPGTWFAIRARLAACLAAIAPKGDVVLTSDDGVLARFAAPEVARALGRRPWVLNGGNKAWFAAQLPVESGMTHLATAPEDAFWRPYELDDQTEAAMEQYLAWEKGVVEQVRRDGFAAFKPLTPDDLRNAEK